jgi:hypothetical protein
MIGVNSSNTMNGNNGPDVLIGSEGDEQQNEWRQSVMQERILFLGETAVMKNGAQK